MIANKLTGRKGVLFTAAYVARFHEMETELEKRKVLRQMSKPIRRNLTDALRDSGEDERMHGHSYATYTDLLYRAAAGKDGETASQGARRRPAGQRQGFSYIRGAAALRKEGSGRHGSSGCGLEV